MNNLILYPNTKAFTNEYNEIVLYRLLPLNKRMVGIYEMADRWRFKDPTLKIIYLPIKRDYTLRLYTGREGMKLWRNISN